MAGWIDVILSSLAGLLLIPILVFCAECALAFPPRKLRRTEATSRTSARPRVAVIVPAHDEETGILTTLRFMHAQMCIGDRVVVVADNCTDATASLAAAAGCEVVRRDDPTRRGKGYALDAGVRYLAESGTRAPEVVIVFDADCVPQRGCVTALTACATDTGRPVQGTYLMALPASPPPGTAVSALAVMVKNLVRPRGLARVGLPCLMTGTGMAFPWEILRKTRLASGNLVEDMQLGIDLTLAGHPPTFCEEARVIGRLPSTAAAAKSQRRRWEHGHLRMLIAQAPRLLFHGVFSRRRLALALLGDLCVPPLSLLMILTSLAAAIAAVAVPLWRASLMPAMVLCCALGCVILCVIVAWLRFGRRAMPVSSVIGAPRYALAKIPLYASFVGRRQRDWVRTARDPIAPVAAAKSPQPPV